MKQILVIHGGDNFGTQEEYISFLKNFEIESLEYFKGKRWKENLQGDLGSDFEVIAPRMPNAFNARYEEWKIWFEKILPLMDDRCVLLGHSLGGTFLAKYLAENTLSKEILATFLVAACFGDNLPEYSLLDFALPHNLQKLEEQGGQIYLYYSKDDMVVPYTDLEKFKTQLPDAQVVSFEDRGHFGQEHFPEIVEVIQKLEF